MTDFSVLDLVPVREGGSVGDALAAATALARTAQDAGCKRFWVAEHHAMKGIAGGATSVVLAHIGNATSTIRIGSGGIMLPNHSPFQIAEQFGTLDALFPGRIDLGLGRAPGAGPELQRALRKDLHRAAEMFPQDVAELIALMAGETAVQPTPGVGAKPEFWMLGSSLFGAQLAAKLGLEAEFDNIKFPSIVPGVQTGRYAAGVNQMGITAERAEVVAFVPYFNSKYGLLVPTGKTDIDINDLCGVKLALTQGSSQIAVAEQLSAKCEADGKEPIGMDFYPNSADTYLAVANGRGDGFLTARAVGVYTAQMNDKLEMTDGILDGRSSISGIVVSKEDPAMQEALTLALVSAVEDGSYAEILEHFGVPEGMLSIEQIQNPPSF